MNSRIGQTDPRAIFDTLAAAIDTNHMVGLNAHGNSGLRYEVDHHYKRLFRLAALTSAFEAHSVFRRGAPKAVPANPLPAQAPGQLRRQTTNQ